MSTRASRGAATKTASMSSEKENISEQLSSPPATPAPANRKAGGRTKPTSKKQTLKQKTNATTDSLVTPKSIGKPSLSTEKTAKKQPLKAEKQEVSSVAANTGRKRKRAEPAPKVEEDPDELPHNMGRRPGAERKVKEEETSDVKPSPKKAKTTRKTDKEEQIEDTKELLEGAKASKAVGEVEGLAKKKAKTAKSYGLTPGKSPFPDWPHPTAEEAQIVHDLLLTTIPDERKPTFIQPDTIPPPRTQIAGCGQVPSILDALIRTLLSAATTGANSSNAFQGLVKRFGLETKGLGKGSVDWNAVRLASQKEVFDAIECGGLADSKSKNIKAILDIVHIENEERRAALNNAKKAGEEFTDEKEAEYQLLQSGALTLDYYHVLSTEDALYTFIELPGIGVKTASCVALFCMQRPSFAVDTHVFRLCKYLGWVPPDESRGLKEKKADRNSTFSHCEVMIPDHLKYGLHQLFLDHGKNCPRCRAATGDKSAGWAEANCVIEHLVKRLGAKKGGMDTPKPTPKKKKGKKVDSEDEAMEDVAEGEEAGASLAKASKKKAAASTAPKKPSRRAGASSTSKSTSKAAKGAKAAKAKTSRNAKKAKDDDEDEDSFEEDEEDEMSDLTDAPESETEFSEGLDED
ncbi:hypothetical protein N7G274_004383 [Stereocaulon virgatum]|uniref:HhH-GPD domain-containing protein n=1 Tax=Stereocaulon virgatum TaxID=373712 RepID=A0ABR4AAX2_9LECA